MKRIGCTIAAALWAAAPALGGNDIIAVGWNGEAFAIDSGTGVGVFLGATGFSQINAMAKAPDGTIYASSGLSTTNIIRIDPNTGAGTLVVASNLGSCRGMAFSNSGTLYAIEDAGFVSDHLYTIDLSNGNKTFIGTTGMPGLQGLAISPTTGRMYGWDVGSGSGIGAGLVTIDINTGAATDVDPNTPGSGNDVQGIGFDAAGNLYGARNSLFSINLSTGAVSLIGSGGYNDTRGMEFLGGGGGGPSIRISGQCPGRVTVAWSNATPGRPMGILFANSTGSFVIPGGVCAGTQTGLSSAGLQLVFSGSTGPNGSGQVSANAGTPACRRFLQMVIADGSPCATSNVAQIP